MLWVSVLNMTSTESLSTDALVPGFVSRLLLIGEYGALFEQRLRNGIQEIWQATRLEAVADQVQANYFDCILATNVSDITKDLNRLLNFTHTLLNENGLFSILFSQSSLNGFTRDSIDDLLVDTGFLSYNLFSEKDLAISGFAGAFVAVRNTYNPVGHARRLAGQGRFDRALQILENIPHQLIGDMVGLAHIAAEKQRMYLQWQKSLPVEVPRHRFLFRSQRELAPDYPNPSGAPAGILDLFRFLAAYRQQQDGGQNAAFHFTCRWQPTNENAVIGYSSRTLKGRGRAIATCLVGYPTVAEAADSYARSF